MILSELAATGQPATLLLPTVGFNEGMKVELLEGEELRRVQLLRSIQSVSGFNQYPFKDLATPAPINPSEEDDALDFIWSSL